MREIYNVHVYNEGDQIWYLNDKIHRVNGPAQESTDGSRYWFLNGVYHRLDGPAVMYADQTRLWWINGIEYTKDVYNTIVSNIVDYYTANYATEFPDECSAMDIISAMNDIAINDMHGVRRYCDIKSKAMNIVKQRYISSLLYISEQYKNTALESKKIVSEIKEAYPEYKTTLLQAKTLAAKAKMLREQRAAA